MNTVLSTSLCHGLADWFNQNTYFKNIFNNALPLFNQIDDYYRVDVPQGEMTSICIYPINSNIRNTKKEMGTIGINITFNLQRIRADRGKLIYSTISAIRAQLLSNPTYVQKFISNTYVPGLQQINSQNEIDYTKLNKQIMSSNGSTTVSLELSYTIDIYMNQRALWLKGLDFYSPITPIYTTVLSTQASINYVMASPIEGYAITPINGYTTNGVAFKPKRYGGNALVLNNNGIVTQTVLAIPLPNVVILQYRYINTPTLLYLSTGVLITKINAVSGNAAILLGDNGTVYNTIYDGNTYNSIFIAETSVTPDNGYLVSGVLMTRIDISVGNAGILFGEDSNIHYVQFI